MSARAGYWLVGTASAVALAGGCAVNGPGASPSETTPPTSEQLPSRPNELNLTGMQDKDLCELLAPEQRAQLGVGQSTPGGPEDAGYPGCIWRSPLDYEPGFSVLVSAAPLGVEEFKEQRVMDPLPETEKSYTVAGGFPAEQAQRGGGFERFGCNVLVDVAEGQTLWISSGQDLAETISNQEMCGKAKQAAELAVTTLQGQG